MQLVNVLEGGKLIQDLDEGKSSSSKKKIQINNMLLQLTETVLLYEITGEQIGQVNSAHHQAIDPDALGKI